jgi:hypothetical protein
MAKAGAQTTTKTQPKKEIIKKTIMPANPTEKILVENSIALQKVMTDLAEKFTNLSTQLSKLLQLFEISAKTLAEKGLSDNTQMLQKLDALLDQNKTIARGIALLHEAEEDLQENMPQKIPPKPMPPMQRPPMTPPPQMPPKMNPPQTPTPPQQTQQKQTPINMQEYQKSISSS